MGVSLGELRARCQLPVRSGNDVAGLLFGDWISLPFTKLFVDCRLSPDIATVGMLVAGLSGSALSAWDGGLAVGGALLLVLYYVLDCVDGEVARFRGVEDMRWGYYDYLFHLLVKPTSFVLVGVGVWRATGQAWPLLAGASAAVATLWLKVFLQVPGILFLHGVMNGKPGGSRAFRRFADALALPAVAAPNGSAHAASDTQRDTAAARPTRGFPLGFNLVTLRALATNYDMGLLALLAATVVDLGSGPLELPLLGSVSARGAWLLFYGCVLPLDFLDYLRTYVRAGHFANETRRLLLLAHHYRFESQTPDDEVPAQRGAERVARP